MYNMYKKSLKPMNLKSRDWSVLSKKTRCRLCTSQNQLIYLIITYYHSWVATAQILVKCTRSL